MKTLQINDYLIIEYYKHALVFDTIKVQVKEITETTILFKNLDVVTDSYIRVGIESSDVKIIERLSTQEIDEALTSMYTKLVEDIQNATSDYPISTFIINVDMNSFTINKLEKHFYSKIRKSNTEAYTYYMEMPVKNVKIKVSTEQEDYKYSLYIKNPY